ncbi:Na+/H+ antiporter NhaA [Actinomyces howellii]|uniref:Na(+)/H(+) antiporter NhaA n=1 Tax=Actinomyces howellii TaxID=52771 RepID=A0A3S4RG62_9ACTO|nr:Na+/H+ antiporter NhaA [Actinomyces howellii]VEG28910.1 Sodium/proton antiporter nhaA [Actinomyces howellii]
MTRTTQTRTTAVVARLQAGFAAFRAWETSGAVLLLAATIVAILWANLGGSSYDDFWHTDLALTLGDAEISMSLQHWINDGLMMMFFFLVSLEVKHDFIMGELSDWRHASVPVVAAVAGLVLPAVLFLALNAGSPGAGAWGVVISTDTAFVVGLLAVFGARLPQPLRAFLVALAVVDDVGALLVIAVAYTESIQIVPLVVVAATALVLYLLQQARLHRTAVYIVAGAVLWVSFLASGVHATIAGVVLGLLLPVFPPERAEVLRAEELTQVFRRTPVAATGNAAVEGILRSVSINERLQLVLAPTINLFIVPLFALANAGVVITAQTLGHAFTSPLTWGIIVGLVVGKHAGVLGATWLATRLRIGALAPGLGYRHIGSGSMLTGIGFTISLFIVELAITDETLKSDARIGVLTASLIAAALGMVMLESTARYDEQHAPARKHLTRPVDPERDHIEGPADAPLTLVEYGRLGGLDDADKAEVLREVRDHFGPELRYVFRHNPGEDPAALQAALALEAVAAQSYELFAPMKRELELATQDEELDARMLRRAAVDVGANLPRLEEAVRLGTHAVRVSDDADDAGTLCLTTAPTFFVGDVIYDGPVEAADLIAALEALRSGDPSEGSERSGRRRRLKEGQQT